MTTAAVTAQIAEFSVMPTRSNLAMPVADG
jgi:hypothetical protein